MCSWLTIKCPNGTLEEPIKVTAHEHIFEGEYGNKKFSRQQHVHVECGEGGAQVECSDIAHMRYC